MWNPGTFSERKTSNSLLNPISAGVEGATHMRFSGFIDYNRKVWDVTLGLWRKSSQKPSLWPVVAVRMSASV